MLSDPQAQLQAKTDYMNDLLNSRSLFSLFRRMSYYYFLWAIHMMYYIDLMMRMILSSYPDSSDISSGYRYDAAIQIPSVLGLWIKQASPTETLYAGRLSELPT